VLNIRACSPWRLAGYHISFRFLKPLADFSLAVEIIRASELGPVSDTVRYYPGETDKEMHQCIAHTWTEESGLEFLQDCSPRSSQSWRSTSHVNSGSPTAASFILRSLTGAIRVQLHEGNNPCSCSEDNAGHGRCLQVRLRNKRTRISIRL
jgi:hypothetical protein